LPTTGHFKKSAHNICVTTSDLFAGRDLAEELELTPQKNGYYYGYNASVNPQIANEFAANAFRFGHTLMQVYKSVFIKSSTLFFLPPANK
jgi:Animal haem peroxidase